LSELPLIGITMGDPAGIGPEIILKALREKAVYKFCRPVILGDPEVLSWTAEWMCSEMSLNIITSPSEAKGIEGSMDLIPVSGLEKGTVLPGNPTPEAAKAMIEYILRAVDMTRTGELDAMVTCPINKALMHQAGYQYEGHTQLIAERTCTDDYVMMLAGERLRVALVTIHRALKDVPYILDTDMVYRTVRITANALRDDFGIERPRLAVAALNPHAGESGLFGSEEEKVIAPAVQRAREEGADVVGPLPSDTLFYKAASGQYDAVVAMYHDQGLIPLKLLHFSDAVNVTLGLPIIRTSVDHGTAYDIAGTGQADDSSLKAAIRMAAIMVGNRRKGVRREA
jgi:4-hydroxythreonine-4-phosphate dehydrogenase